MAAIHLTRQIIDLLISASALVSAKLCMGSTVAKHTHAQTCHTV